MSEPKIVRKILMEKGSASLQLAIWSPRGWRCAFCQRVLKNIKRGTGCMCQARVFQASPDWGNTVYHRNILSDGEVTRLRRTLTRHWGDEDVRWLAERLEALEYDLVHERERD